MLESGCSSHSSGKASELETPCGASTIDGRPGNKQRRGNVQSPCYLPIFLERSVPVLPEQREVHIELLNFAADTSYLRYTSTRLLSPRVLEKSSSPVRSSPFTGEVSWKVLVPDSPSRFRECKFQRKYATVKKHVYATRRQMKGNRVKRSAQ